MENQLSQDTKTPSHPHTSIYWHTNELNLLIAVKSEVGNYILSPFVFPSRNLYNATLYGAL